MRCTQFFTTDDHSLPIFASNIGIQSLPFINQPIINHRSSILPFFSAIMTGDDLENGEDEKIPPPVDYQSDSGNEEEQDDEEECPIPDYNHQRRSLVKVDPVTNCSNLYATRWPTWKVFLSVFEQAIALFPISIYDMSLVSFLKPQPILKQQYIRKTQSGWWY